MKDEKATKQNLLDCAKQEFLEKGYADASLRSICKKAGVTTGALYFFFNDKESLFASLVEEPLNILCNYMIQHYNNELELIKNNNTTDAIEFLSQNSADIKTAYDIIHYMYQYYDEFQLLLTKSQGSKFMYCIDSFIELAEKQNRILADYICDLKQLPKLDDYIIHWLSHMLINMFIYMVTHVPTEQEAKCHITIAMKYFISGWYGLFNDLK